MPETTTGAALLEVARSFLLRIVAERDGIEVSRRLPEDLGRELARAGFFRIFLPEAYGGLDLTPMEAMEVEELARADASVAWCVWTAILIGLPLNSCPTLPEQSTPTPMSLPQTVRAPPVRRR
jgi:alkylation response protein AidB-like acyl-CoA dehydrogenase